MCKLLDLFHRALELLIAVLVAFREFPIEKVYFTSTIPGTIKQHKKITQSRAVVLRNSKHNIGFGIANFRLLNYADNPNTDFLLFVESTTDPATNKHRMLVFPNSRVSTLRGRKAV